MKRLLVRISALATVVVLGLIAIAQAQRGMGDLPPEADGAEGSISTGVEESTPAPIMALADAGGSPWRFTSGDRVNPLRPVERQNVADKVIPASGTSSRTDAVARAPAASSEVDRTVPAQSPDPLLLRATGHSPTLAGDNQHGSLREISPGTIPSDLPLEGPTTGPLGHPQLVGPADADALEIGSPVDAGTLPPTAGERYNRQPALAAGPNEPAPFRPDSDSPSAIIPNPGAGNGDRFPPSATDVAGTRRVPSAMAPGQFDQTAPGLLGQGTGMPGNRQLEGAQSPQLTVEKFAPAEIQVGKPATFQIKVRNTSQVAARGVELHDEIPKGTRLISTTPRASRGVRGELVWSLGTMRPGDEMSAEIKLMPIEEGELGSVATLHFTAEASVRTLATKPELAIESSAPSQVLIGEEVAITITIFNPGSGMAEGVVLEEHVPAGLRHSAGSELEYEIGQLKPKESRQLQLVLVAERPGQITNLLTARGEANLKTESRLQLEVLAPDLEVAMQGPTRRYLEREATYTLSISNPGTAPARQVSLVAYLPSGLQFVSANNAGYYDEASRSVRWQMEQLPVQETGTVKLTTMPVEAGEQTLRVSGSTSSGLSVETQQPVLIEGIAAILFEVVDVDDPIEMGGETTYEIRVLNQGSKAATNVQISALLPPQMRPIAAEGPVEYAIQGNGVLFEGLPRLAPKADTTYRIRVQGLKPGDQRIRVQLTTHEIRNPVTKEESTRVYSDQ